MEVTTYIASGVLELYTMQALTPQESREVERMAQQYPEIQAEIDALNATMEQYAFAHAQTPRPELKAQILNALPEKQSAAHTSTVESPTSNVVQMTPSWRRYASAAAVVGLVASMSANVLFYSKWQNADQRAGELLAQSRELVDNNATLKASYQKSIAQLNSIAQPMVKMVHLKGMAIAPKTDVMVFWNQEEHKTMLTVKEMSPPPPNMEYQLWAIVGGKPVDAGMVTMVKDSMYQIMQPIGDVQAFAITLEKKGGSPSPTMDQMYAMGKL
jgi:anti-sigma-K factor RskA